MQLLDIIFAYYYTVCMRCYVCVRCGVHETFLFTMIQIVIDFIVTDTKNALYMLHIRSIQWEL